MSNLAVIGRGGVHLRQVALNFLYIHWFIFKSVIREKVEIKVQKRDRSAKEDRKSGENFGTSEYLILDYLLSFFFSMNQLCVIFLAVVLWCL